MASKEYFVCTWKLPKYTSLNGFDGTTGAELAASAGAAGGVVAAGALSREQAVTSATTSTKPAGFFNATCIGRPPTLLG
jgi:hypothetical protein